MLANILITRHIESPNRIMLRYAATFQVYYSELVGTFTGNAHKQNIDDIIISTYIYCRITILRFPDHNGI